MVTPWRPDLKPHPLAALIPGMLRDEYVGLVANIKAHGLRQPIMLYEGLILDGRDRHNACVELGIVPMIENFTGTDAEAEAFVLSINVHRRHLTLEQKEKIVAAELKRDPTQSDRSIGKKAKVDHKTVAKARKAAEQGGEIPHHSERVGADGVTQPAKKNTATPETPVDPAPEQGAEDPRATANRELAAAMAEAKTLPESAKAKFDRIVKRAHAALQEEFWKACREHEREHRAELWATVNERVAREKQDYTEAAAKATEQRKRYFTKCKTFDHWITENDHKFVLGCLHPDKADRSPESLAKAFALYKRTIEQHLSPDARTLRKNGWPSWADMPERKRRARTAQASAR